MPRPLATATAVELRRVEGVALDIDETLSTRGQVTADAFGALWALKEEGFAVAPITGRPAGWCDHIARFWPVHAVVGENGAFTFFMKDGVRRRIDTPGGPPDARSRRAKLDELGRSIQERFPHARWASDQAYREFDLAIDICEDVPAWPRGDLDALLALCAERGACARLSSVHVNAWFGDFDKRRGFEHWLEQGQPGLGGRKVPMEKWLFIGDSPNDEPMFAAFPYSVGVANLRQYLDRLHHPPTWITRAESGAGFVELARRLVALRKKGGRR